MGCLHRSPSPETPLPATSGKPKALHKDPVYLPLDYARRASGIPRLDDQCVEGYKNRKIRELMNPPPVARIKYRPRPAKALLCFIIMLIACVLITKNNSWVPLVPLVSSFIACLLSARGTRYTVMEPGRPHHEAEWIVEPLEEYTASGRTYPPEVSGIIAEMRMRCYEAKPFVHSLYSDPFLEFRRYFNWPPKPGEKPLERFYAAVWNAPDFTP